MWEEIIMKKTYNEPQFEVEKFTISDVMTTSQGIPDSPLDDEGNSSDSTIY